MHATHSKLTVSLSFKETIRSVNDLIGRRVHQQTSVSHFAMFWLTLVFDSSLSCQRGTFIVIYVTLCLLGVTVLVQDCKAGFICFLPARKAFAAAFDEVEDKAIANSLAAT